MSVACHVPVFDHPTYAVFDKLDLGETRREAAGRRLPAGGARFASPANGRRKVLPVSHLGRSA